MFEVGVETDDLEKMYAQMAEHARALHLEEIRAQEIEDFLEKGNKTRAYDVSETNEVVGMSSINSFSCVQMRRISVRELVRWRFGQKRFVRLMKLVLIYRM